LKSGRRFSILDQILIMDEASNLTHANIH